MRAQPCTRLFESPHGDGSARHLPARSAACRPALCWVLDVPLYPLWPSVLFFPLPGAPSLLHSWPRQLQIILMDTSPGKPTGLHDSLAPCFTRGAPSVVGSAFHVSHAQPPGPSLESAILCPWRIHSGHGHSFPTAGSGENTTRQIDNYKCKAHEISGLSSRAQLIE